MWSRHRPDVSRADLIAGWLGMLRPSAPADDELVADWFPPGEAVVCLSVRSGFDLLLGAMRLQPGDEILFTEITIEGMLRVARARSAEVRSAPIDRHTLAPTADAIAQRLTPRTRAIVLAPLFGARYSLASISEVARRRGVIVIEDAAQAFAGRAYPGSPDADVTMFSFGMIKRATAGGGAVLRVRDAALRRAMLAQLASYPRQTRADYTRRLAMLTLLRGASHHRLYGLVYRLLRRLGDPDQLVSRMGKTRRSQQSLERLRRRPCGPMKRLMRRRIAQHEQLPTKVDRQTFAALGEAVCGSRAEAPPSWVLPVLLDDVEQAIKRLLSQGFDASRLSSLVRLDGDKRSQLLADESSSEHWLARTLFLPTDERMPRSVRQIMIHEVLAQGQ